PKTQSMKIPLWLVTLFFLFQTSITLAEVTATTGRTVLSIDETIQLTIKSDSSSDDPDLSILDDNFQILGRSQSQNYSYINGNASRTHTWSISLLPKKTGEITIPAIKVGNETTQAIHLVIQKQSKTPGVDGKDVYLKIELAGDSNEQAGEEKSYYVQQQLLVTVQLFHRIRFSNATLSELEIENTVVEKLGNDANYSKNIANHRYNIIERRYAIYPQQSGPLVIPALTFSGNAEISQSFSLFSRPGRQIISRTKPLTVNILAIPDSYTGKHWLPAENLEIESEILEDTHSIVSGEAITRHIIVRAKGLLGSQLPATSVSSSKKIKTYPDKEKLSNQLVNGKVVGVRRDTIAIIPLKSGEFTLPEIKINWWNTLTNQQQTTRLAARTLLAQPNSDQLAQIETNKQTSQLQVPSQDQPSSTASEKDAAKSIEPITRKEVIYKNPKFTKNLWFWVSIALLIIWLMTIALFIVSSSKNKQQKKSLAAAKKSSPNQLAAQEYLQQVYQACETNNAHNASKSLVQWAKFHFNQPMISGLSTVTELIDTLSFDNSLGDAINHLESCQYSQDKENWQGNNLSSALKEYLHQESTDKKVKKNQTPQAFSSLNP
ncbi:MAG: BatD family protein, partial [gamma proteobacterium symbiont of Bathyaustriella thionipta]|nr:BatD family protein [gamma proteobacterium symbiont of Bathyaustriella thionipta]